MSELLALGVLTKPKVCPHCCHGGLHGPFPQHDGRAADQRMWYCDWPECRQRTNVLQGCDLLTSSCDRFRTLTPSNFLLFLYLYYSPDVPSLSSLCRKTGLGERTGLTLCKLLREREAQLGRKQLQSLTLHGRVEADATVLRKVYVSVNSDAWKEHIHAWKKKHPKASLPAYFMGHIRCAGLAERGQHGKVLCVPLPLELQSPGSRPPTESVRDVQTSELLSKLDVKNTHLFSDGNRAWAKCATEAGIVWSQVKHCLMQFARSLKRNGKKLTAGTQKIDRMWGCLDDFLPKTLNNKSKHTRLVNDQLFEYMYQWQWRRNAGKNLWQHMPEVFDA